MARLAAARAAKSQAKKSDNADFTPQASELEKSKSQRTWADNGFQYYTMLTVNYAGTERKAMTKAKEKAVWNDTKGPTRKRAASSVPQPEKVKQPRKHLEKDPGDTQCVDSEQPRSASPMQLQNRTGKRKPVKVTPELPADADEGDDDASDSNRSQVSDEDEIPSGDNDLEVLETKPSKLKATLLKEARLSFFYMPRFSFSKPKPSDDPPRLHSRSGSSAVSEQSFATGPPSEPEDNISSSDLEKPIATHYRKRSGEIDQAKMSKNTKTPVAVPSRHGKRELARNLEKPKWKAAVPKAPSSDGIMLSDASDSDVEVTGVTSAQGSQLGKRGEVELQWPETSRLRYNDD
ncbi:hypothetical protein BJ138DRAFT_1119935, partial [Hygrophoropsis aurantiaca]